jgi:hypothetical protein
MKFGFLSFALLCSLIASTQESMVSSRYHKTYMGIDNSLDVIVEGCSCSSISITTDNGKLDKHGCQYVYRPIREGEATFTIYKKQNGKPVKLRTHKLIVYPIPPPVLSVGTYPNGSEISRAAFIVQTGVSANFYTFLDVDYRVVNFSVLIMRDSTTQLVPDNPGNLFNDKMSEAFKKMETGSTILFFNVWVSGPDGKPFKAQPLEYIIR